MFIFNAHDIIIAFMVMKHIVTRTGLPNSPNCTKC